MSHSIDDFNTTLIQYNGSWDAINSTTKQWDGTAHTTGQAGATATFHFRGKNLWQLIESRDVSNINSWIGT